MTRRITYAVLCGVFAVLGALAIAAGALLALTFGTRGELRSVPTQLDGPGAALVAEHVEIEASNIPIPDGVGELTIEVTPAGRRALFVGTAAQAPLDGYLTGVPYDVVTSLEPGGQGQIRSVPGTQLPPPPADQTFWLAQREGAPGEPVTMRADIDERTSLVLMNADPAEGVVADVRVTLTVDWAWTAALALFGGGLGALLVAVLFGWRSRAAGRRARRGLHAAGGPGSPGGPGGEVAAAAILPHASPPLADPEATTVLPPVPPEQLPPGPDRPHD